MSDEQIETISLRKVQNLINNVLMSYAEEYKSGRMNFSEYAIIENIGVRLQQEFDKELEEEWAICKG